MRVVFLGRIPSSLVRALGRRGHDVVATIRDADLVVVGTDLGPAEEQALETARGLVTFHPVVDPDEFFPADCAADSLLGYVGTYSRDGQGHVASLLIEPARRLPNERFVVAGPQFPPTLNWPSNVVRIEHLPPGRRRQFYATQSFASGELRSLFEAAACCIPIVTTNWDGLGEFFEPGREVFVVSSADEAYEVLTRMSPAERSVVARRARRRVLAEHTPDQRARQLERLVCELGGLAE